MNKRTILKRIDSKISDIFEAMIAGKGLDPAQYMRKVGACQELKDLRDFVVEVPDDDDGDGELEDLD